MLIVRELLLGAAGYAALRASLPGLASNLLVQRLGEMESDGLVKRSAHPARSKSVRYELTELGLALEPTILELIRWGAVWMQRGPGNDLVDARWAALALRALLNSSAVTKPAGELAIECDGERLTVAIGPKGRVVTLGESGNRMRALVQGSFPAILALAAGQMTLASNVPVTVDGDRDFAEAALQSPRVRS